MSTSKQSINVLKLASQQLTLTSEQSERLAIMIQILEEATEGEQTDLNVLNSKLDAAGITMREFANNVELAYSGLSMAKENVQHLSNALVGAKTAIQTNSGMFAGIAAGQATQQKATNIATITGDVAQLIFA